MFGHEGNDTLDGGRGDDYLERNSGNDVLRAVLGGITSSVLTAMMSWLEARELIVSMPVMETIFFQVAKVQTVLMEAVAAISFVAEKDVTT